MLGRSEYGDLRCLITAWDLGPLPGERSSGVPATDRDARVRAGLLGLGLGSKLLAASPLKQGKALSLITNISSPLSHTQQRTLSGPTWVVEIPRISRDL